MSSWCHDKTGSNEPLLPLLLVLVSVSHLSAVSCKGHLVFEGLGGARTSLVAYNTMHGTCLKQLPAQASNDGITSVNASHPGHGVSPRSLRPRRQTPAPAAITAPGRISLHWNACCRDDTSGGARSSRIQCTLKCDTSSTCVDAEVCVRISSQLPLATSRTSNDTVCFSLEDLPCSSLAVAGSPEVGPPPGSNGVPSQVLRPS